MSNSRRVSQVRYERRIEFCVPGESLREHRTTHHKPHSAIARARVTLGPVPIELAPFATLTKQPFLDDVER